MFTEDYERLVRTLTAITGDEEVARDCVQDAFVKAATKWRRIRRYDDPAAWVRRVAINRSRDIHRADQRRQRREARAGSEQPPEAMANPTDAVNSSMNLVELLKTLPERQRHAASLFYVADLPVTEIASIMAISTGAVKFHLNEARNTLRAVVDREGQHHG